VNKARGAPETGSGLDYTGQFTICFDEWSSPEFFVFSPRRNRDGSWSDHSVAHGRLAFLQGMGACIAARAPRAMKALPRCCASSVIERASRSLCCDAAISIGVGEENQVPARRQRTCRRTDLTSHACAFACVVRCLATDGAHRARRAKKGKCVPMRDAVAQRTAR
jgi:hypothetical protein